MRRLVLLFTLLALLLSVGNVLSAQEAKPRQRRPSPESVQRRAIPRPEPPRYHYPERDINRNRRYDPWFNFGFWFDYRYPPYRYNRYPYRDFYSGHFNYLVCQPGYWIVVGYDYYGYPYYDWVSGFCNVRGHYHSTHFYYGR